MPAESVLLAQSNSAQQAKPAEWKKQVIVKKWLGRRQPWPWLGALVEQTWFRRDASA
jgi:hypothetical protein